MTTELELVVPSDWEEMERVYQAASDFLESRNLSSEALFRYTMVICELVENGMKYGYFRNHNDAVAVRVNVSEKTITVQVTNPVGKTTKAYLDELDRTIQWVRSFQDPYEAYLYRMKAISREPPDASKSGLGIVRITYEGRAALDFYLEEDNMLSVSAVAKIERREGEGV